MNVKAWLDIYDDTQYRDGNWNVDIVAETFRTLLADIDELYDEVSALKVELRKYDTHGTASRIGEN